MRNFAVVAACLAAVVLTGCSDPAPGGSSSAPSTSPSSSSQPGATPASSGPSGSTVPATTASGEASASTPPVRTPTTSAPGETVVPEPPGTGGTHRTVVVIVAPAAQSQTSGVDECIGTGDYAAVMNGVAVRVVDGTGEELASVPLSGGRRSGEADDCTWQAEVLLPTDRYAYRALIDGWGSSQSLVLEDLYQPIVIQPNG